MSAAQQAEPKQVRVALKMRDDLGLKNVIPARGKVPQGAWKKHQHEVMTDADVRREFTRAGRDCNFWVPTGAVNGIVVLDVDNEAGEEYLRSIPGLAEAMDKTACVRTGSGMRHYYFRLEEGDPGFPTWRHHDPDGASFDVQCNGAGVVVPPSTHESGRKYEWVRPLA